MGIEKNKQSATSREMLNFVSQFYQEPPPRKELTQGSWTTAAAPGTICVNSVPGTVIYSADSMGIK